MTDPHAGQPVVTVGLPLSERGRAVIMVHGRGAAPRNILDLVPRLDREGFTYTAPAAAGQSWYPLSFLADVEKNEPYLTSAIHSVERLVDDLARAGVSTDRTVILGFSQGACLSAEFVYRHPARWGGVVLFSGGLIGPPGIAWSGTGRLDGTPIFLGCSDADAHVPRTRVDETADVFARMGADVTERIYPGMGHVVNDDEIRCAQEILDRVGSG